MATPEFQRVCLETLVSGDVQSFVDMVFLACDGRLAEANKLETVREHLVRAENARRRGDTVTVIDNYSELASLFEDHGPSIYFLERSLEIAKVMNNTEAEMTAYQQLGVAYEKTNQPERALQYHQSHRALADACDSEQHRSAACEHLVRVYDKQARDAEQAGRLEDALDYYLHAVEAAGGSGNARALAAASFNAGRTCVLLGRPLEGVPHLQTNLRITIETGADGPPAAESKAYAALAAAYLAADKLAEATECLEELLSASDDPECIAEANEHLGIVCARTGRAEEALGYLQPAFNTRASLLARGLGSRAKLDKLRILLGIVRAGACMPDHMRAIARSDVTFLLHWKARPTTGMEHE